MTSFDSDKLLDSPIEDYVDSKNSSTSEVTPDQIPQPLIEQLKPGGRLVIPVGTRFQELKVLLKTKGDKILEENIIPVRFVPMVHPQNTIPDNSLHPDQ